MTESGWKGHGRPGFTCDALTAAKALEAHARRSAANRYHLADLHLTRAHKGPVLFAEFPLRTNNRLCRESLEREVTSALAYIREVTK